MRLVSAHVYTCVAVFVRSSVLLIAQSVARSLLLWRSRTFLANGPRLANGGGFYLKDQGNAADGAFTLKVNVAPIADPDPSYKGSVERIEDKRANDEVAMFDQASQFAYMRGPCALLFGQACAEMEGLTDIVLNELGVVQSFR